ncbi:MAG TPA: Uma2 family endonuclease [Mycobacteriales bacterium]|jgi:Uma2 family endonuclease|nr:Uma2 family endonuclease [Mycobacteriales bacterium]
MTSAELVVVAFEDYLAHEQFSDRRHEWVAGHVYVMAGGTERHDNLAGLLYLKLAPQALADGCRPYQHNRKVKIGQVAYYPDLLVVCRDALPPDRQYERDLSVVVEVLSPSTEGVDRREKALVYSSAPSFERYLLVDPDRRRIEVATLGPAGLQWQSFGPGDVVPYVDLDVDALYDELDAVTLT